MTRAAQRLVISGFHGSRGKVQDCWYDMARAGLDGAMTEHPSSWASEEKIWRLGDVFPATRESSVERPAPPLAAPAWLSARAAAESGPAPLNPSRVFSFTLADAGSEARKDRLEAGRLSHSLLQYLPDIAPAQRREAALRFLQRRAAPMDRGEREAIVERVLKVIGDPRLAGLFAAGSQTEVAIAANLPGSGQRASPFAGRIDRIAIGEDSVLIADFKSGAPHGETPFSYLLQLALYRTALAPLYPDRAMRTFLVWLARPDIVEIAPAALDQALAKLMAHQ
jgi:ATP-dependent helicase/nuclease subunit A